MASGAEAYTVTVLPDRATGSAMGPRTMQETRFSSGSMFSIDAGSLVSRGVDDAARAAKPFGDAYVLRRTHHAIAHFI